MKISKTNNSDIKLLNLLTPNLAKEEAMQTGTFQKTETRTENTAHGKMEYRFTLKITIKEASYNGKPMAMYQTEQTFRSGVMTTINQYPANTEYAQNHRQWVCDF